MNKVERHMDICKGLNKIYEQKNHDYGDSFHDTFAEEGMAMARIRLSDKLNRFKKLSKAGSEQKVNDESIRDTLLDLANYAIMTVMEMDILEEEEARVKLRTALREHRNNLMKLGSDSLLNKTFQIPQNFIANSDHICPACGNKMEWHPEIDRYTCGNCGAAYGVKASSGKPDVDPDPCEKCTYEGKGYGCECVDRVEWERRQRGDTDATEDEQADGRWL